MVIFDAVALGNLTFKFVDCLTLADRSARRCLVRLLAGAGGFVVAVALAAMLAGV